MDRGTTGDRRRRKRLGDGNTGAGGAGADVLAEGSDWALGVDGEVAERGGGSWSRGRSGIEAEGDWGRESSGVLDMVSCLFFLSKFG